MNPLIRDNIEQIRDICKNHFVKNLYLFGSALSENFTENSDVDFLYELDSNLYSNKNGFDYAENFFDLENKLTQLLQRKIDLIRFNLNRKNIFLNTIGNKKLLLYES